MTIVTKAGFARLAGVSPSAISKALPKSLKEAVTNEGRIDTEHPAAVRYMSRAGWVGRNPGSKKDELADWIIASAAELRALEPLLPYDVDTASMVELVSNNICYLGFSHKTMPEKERGMRMAWVERSLFELRAEAQPKTL